MYKGTKSHREAEQHLSLGYCLHFGSPERLSFLISLLPPLLELVAVKWTFHFTSNLMWVQPELGEKARPAYHHLIWSKSTEVWKNPSVSNELRGKRLCFSPGDGILGEGGKKKVEKRKLRREVGTIVMAKSFCSSHLATWDTANKLKSFLNSLLFSLYPSF